MAASPHHVAEQRRSVVTAAHLLRYRDDAEVGAAYRDAGEVHWFVHHPRASLRPDAEDAADLLMSACLARLARWNVTVERTLGECGTRFTA
ncbi:hypothetical protein ACFWWC_39785 [Streptomyces sp. NPDC058642]|uniref:hypothetical protein n=1 Tax=Streptomyces sp. NPDC058642 TaxID=3346572 RepID=UPI003662F43C